MKWKSMFGLKVAFVAGVAVFASGTAFAATESGQSVANLPEPTKPEGKRPAEILLNYRSDLVAPVQGGIKRQNVMIGNLTLGAQFDFERLARLKGTSGLVQAQAIHGKSPSRFVGDAQTLSNIDGPESLSLYQAWLNQSLVRDRLSVLAGVHDISTEFYQTESSLLLLNSTFAVGPELSRSGVNGPSVYPVTGLAAVVKARPIQQMRVRLGIYDGVPGDPKGEPRGTHLGLSKSEGFLAVGEVTTEYESRGQKGMCGLGYWRYSLKQQHRLDKDDDGKATLALSQGAYAIFNQKLYSAIEGFDLGLSGFLRVGFASDASNPITQSFAAGFSYLGPFNSRLEDTASIGFALARSGKAERAAREADWNATPHRWEGALELAYRYKALSWFSVQPDFQWIIHPGFNPAINNALVGATRFEFQL